MGPVVADTHVVLWYVLESPRLSAAALKALQGCVQERQPIYMATVSIVEMVYLIERQRLSREDLDLVLNRLDKPGGDLFSMPLDVAIAETLAQVPASIVPDMPDRIITATALYLGIPLVTKDSRIESANIKTIW